jgi:hypothetical protein
MFSVLYVMVQRTINGEVEMPETRDAIQSQQGRILSTKHPTGSEGDES